VVPNTKVQSHVQNQKLKVKLTIKGKNEVVQPTLQKMNLAPFLLQWIEKLT